MRRLTLIRAPSSRKPVNRSQALSASGPVLPATRSKVGARAFVELREFGGEIRRGAHDAALKWWLLPASVVKRDPTCASVEFGASHSASAARSASIWLTTVAEIMSMSPR